MTTLAQYADRIAAQVRAWIDEAPVLDSTKRPLTPGDILILVRSRGELASLIVARLFQRRVPVAGIDRLFLSKPFAVRDLLAAVTFAVQPLDDLNLANLLVSPLIGWDQQQLFDLAYGREKSAAVANSSRAGRRAPRFRRGACAARRAAGDGRLHDAVAISGNDTLRTAPGTAQTLRPPRPCSARSRSTS